MTKKKTYKQKVEEFESFTKKVVVGLVGFFFVAAFIFLLFGAPYDPVHDICLEYTLESSSNIHYPAKPGYYCELETTTLKSCGLCTEWTQDVYANGSMDYRFQGSRFR